MSRLKADKKKELLGRLKLLSQKKVLTIKEQYEIDWSWKQLYYDFFNKLSLDLRHISGYALLDSLNKTTDEMGIDSPESYVKHFDNQELKIIYAELMEAANGILYLCNICEREMNARNSDKSKMERHNDEYCNVKHFDFNPISDSLKQITRVCNLNRYGIHSE